MASVKDLAVLFREFQEREVDQVVAITGSKGMGKSVLALRIVSAYIYKYFHKWPVSSLKYICYNNADMQKVPSRLPPFSPIIADEAVRFAMGEDWNRAENKELKKIMTQIRTRKYLFFMLIPKFRWLDSKYREELVTMWIRIINRGLAVIFIPDMSETKDRWHLDRLDELIPAYNYFTDTKNLLDRIKKHPCYLDTLRWKDIHKGVYEKYLKIRDEKVFAETVDLNQKLEDKNMMAKLMLFNLYTRWAKFKLQVDLNPKKYPNSRLMSEYLFVNPVGVNKLLSPPTVEKWIRDVAEIYKIPIDRKALWATTRELKQNFDEFNTEPGVGDVLSGLTDSKDEEEESADDNVYVSEEVLNKDEGIKDFLNRAGIKRKEEDAS